MYQQHLLDHIDVSQNLLYPARVIKFVNVIGIRHIAKGHFKRMKRLIVYFAQVDVSR